MSLTVALLALALAAQDQSRLPIVGTNLAPLGPGSTQWPFVDLVAAHPGRAGSPSDGRWEFGAAAGGKIPAGDYTLLWDGTADIAVELDGTVKDRAAGRMTVTVGPGGVRLVVKSGQPSNLRFVMPGFAASYESQPFHPVFLQRMSLYRAIRFASWTTGPRGSSVSTPPAGGLPGAFDRVVALANEKVSDPWVTLPTSLTQAQVEAQARRLAEGLKPTLTVLVESGDQAWRQPDGGVALARRQTGWFTRAFGRADRVVRVLSLPFGDVERATRLLEADEAYRDFDAIAVEPVFGPGLTDPGFKAKAQADGLDAVFPALKAEIEGPVTDRLRAFAALAAKHRLLLLSSSGGAVLQTSDPDLAPLFAEAVRDSRMGEAYEALLKAWRKSGGSLFVHSRDCGTFRPGEGVVSALEYQNQDVVDAPVHQTLVKYGLFPERFDD